MSNHGGGHRRRHNRGADDHGTHDHRRETFDTPEQKLRKTIISLGEVDPVQELPRLANEIRASDITAGAPPIPAITEGFRIGVTEQPFKIPYYAALLRLLHEQQTDVKSEAPTDTTIPVGRQVLEDFWKGFQAFLDKLAWREIRLCIQFFAHCTMAGLVSSQSMLEFLKSFTAVLQEFGVSHGRAMNAALCAAEGLMIAGPAVKDAVDVSEIITALRDYSESVSSSKTLVRPMVRLYDDFPVIEHADELLDSAITVLNALKRADFAQTADSFPQPYMNLPEVTTVLFDLPSVLVPPEVIELDGLTTDAGEDAQVIKEEWPAYFVRLFDNDVTPDPATPSGYAIRSAILDIIDVFEVNRKECARLLLEYPKWTLPGTFKPRPGAPEQIPVPEKDWQLENTIIETALGSLFLLPESGHKPVYYIALITEIAKLSPQTVGPAVGKSIRKLYGLLADGLDVEVAHRFADWFSVHMSNFGFAWVWKEWVPDLSLSVQHPKRLFVRKALEYEIRLSYYDRVMKTLPEPMQAPEAYVMPTESPGPEYEYDDPTGPHHDAAQSLLSLLRGRTKADDVVAHLDSLKNTISETAEGDVNVNSVIRSIAVQSLLHIGNRSFSHFLNAIERYLPLLRNIAAGGGSAAGGSNFEARMDILNAVAFYWKRIGNMIVIVFDKLMQYQIVDPTDVVSWTFSYGGALSGTVGQATFDAFQWDVLKGALDKANGRVTIARKKVTALRKEADDTAARAIATESAAMEVDAEAKADVMPAAESPALTTALKAFATLTKEQKAALACTLDGFVEYLAAEDKPNPTAREVIAEKAWHNRANWTDVHWQTWQTWGWFRHFTRVYSPYLRNYTQTLEQMFLTKVGPSDPAVDVFRKTWNIATGQEV